MEKYQVTDLDSVTPELVMTLIERYKTKELERLNKLYSYYMGDTDINRRAMNDPQKPNNRIVNPFSSLITDTVVGYVGGKPVVYQSEDKELMIKVQDVFDRNHEHSHNRQLFKKMTIMGVVYELLYITENADVGMAVVDPRECFLIYDNTVEENTIAGVRFLDIPDYTTDTIITRFYLYTEHTISEYEVNDKGVDLIDEKPNNFGGVPIVKYQNNDDCTGAFEKVLTLIDAYDLTVSDTQNNLEYFADAYLVISGGAEFEDDSEVSDMKENRVMILPDGAKAEWLTKQISEEAEEYKKRLKEDIHQLSQIPNIADESFSNQQSGEALKYKLFGLENLVSITEGYFKEGLEDRIELLTNVLNLKSSVDYDYTYITIVFTRNLPQNLTNLADIASKLVGIISNETLFALMPFVDDPALEAERVAREVDFAEDDFHDEIQEIAGDFSVEDYQEVTE